LKDYKKVISKQTKQKKHISYTKNNEHHRSLSVQHGILDRQKREEKNELSDRGCEPIKSRQRQEGWKRNTFSTCQKRHRKRKKASFPFNQNMMSQKKKKRKSPSKKN